MPSPRQRMSWVVAGFVVLTAVVFRPTPFGLAHTAPEIDGSVGDGVYFVWAIGHVSGTLFSRPWALFDGGMLHPTTDTLAFSDHMIGQALLGYPIWFLTRSSPFEGLPVGNALLEFNLLVLASYVLGATAAFVYVRALVGSTAAATAAGIAFVFSPLRFRSPHYIQSLCTFFLPLMLLAWLRFVEQPSRRWWRWWVVLWCAHALMGMYAAVYTAVLMGVLGCWALWAAPTRADRRLWIGTLLAPVAALIVLAPTLWPYVRARSVLGLERTGGYQTFLPMLLPAEETMSGAVVDVMGALQWGPGLVVCVLGALGIVVGRRRSTSGALPGRFLWQVNAFGLATLLVLILLPLPWIQRVPGLDLMRTSHRPFFLALVFIAYFVGEGVAWAEARMPSPQTRSAAGILLTLLVALDMGTPPRERRIMPVQADLPQIYRNVRALPDVVVHDDPGGRDGPAIALYLSLFHGKRLAGGSSAFAGPWGEYALARYALFPRDDATTLLWDVGVRHVVRHYPTGQDADVAARAVEARGMRVVTQLETDLLIRLREPVPLPRESVVTLPRDRWSVRASDDFVRIEALRDDSPATGTSVRLAEASEPWIVVDIVQDSRQPLQLAGVRVAPVRAHDVLIYRAQVEVSLDGERWDAPRTWFEPDDLEALIERPSDVRFFEARFVPTPARYVRLTNPRAHYRGDTWEIGELDVLASP